MRVHKLCIAEVGKSCNPITLKVMGDAFDSAWGQVVDQFSACDVRAAQRARLVVAEAIIAHATETSRDLDQLRQAGLHALFLQYPWLLEGQRKQA